MSGEALPPHHANCMGCGPDNPAGVAMRMERDGDRVRGSVELDRRHEGAPGYAHGGAVTTILDDALGMLLFILRRPAVTARIEVDFRRPAYIGRPFEVEAWVDRVEGRKLWMAATLRDAGEVVAEARSLFLVVEPEHFARGVEAARDADPSLRFPW
ncbi:MAG TPA: PaaI family thioesterase [Thermoleophilaceae bacterium]|nr:PaaI family thioesterase [Thermoleophilaceae bacterium]